MNSIYQTLSESRSLSEMCEIFELPELAQRALLIPPFKSLNKKRPISEISTTDETCEECSIIELKPDHRYHHLNLSSVSFFLFFFTLIIINCILDLRILILKQKLKLKLKI